MSYPNPTTIAIIGGDPLVGHALELALQCGDYDTKFLDGSSYTDGEADPLEGVSLVLLAPRASDADRKVLLSHLHSSGIPEKAMAVPVLELLASTNGVRNEEEEVRRVLWPCRMKDLKREIEAALL